MNLIEKYNMLTVISTWKVDKDIRATVICDCGTEKEVSYWSLKSKRGIKSCGCACKEAGKVRSESGAHDGINNGRYLHGGKGTRIYGIWKGIRQRCLVPSNISYPWYGALGIRRCELWNDFNEFKIWSMQNGYSDNLTIDRIDSSKDYSPENCRWVTQEFQKTNTKSNRYIDYDWVKYHVAGFAKKFGLTSSRVTYLLNKGYDTNKILSHGTI